MTERGERTVSEDTASRALRLAVARQACRDGTLRQARQDAKLSLSELAESVDATPQTLWKWETGMRSPRADKALLLFDTLKLLLELEVAK